MTIAPKTPIEALAATIADFKADPKIRTRNDLAKDKFGWSVRVFDPEATCFCAIGLYSKHRGIDLGEQLDRTYYRQIIEDFNLPGASSVWGVNDDDRSPNGEKIIARLEDILAEATA